MINIYQKIKEKLIENTRNTMEYFEPRTRLSSQKIYNLNNMNQAAQKSMRYSIKENPLEANSYLEYCGYCDSKLFPNDRVCPQCGAPVKNSVSKNTVRESPKNNSGNRFIISIGSCFGYDRETGELLFDGKTLLDSSLQVSLGKGNLYYLYLHEGTSYNICDLNWSTANSQSIVKLIIEAQVCEYDDSSNIISVIQLIFPCFQLDSWGKQELKGQSLAYEPEDNDLQSPCYGYCKISE